MGKNYYSKEGLERLRQSLKALKGRGRASIASQISEAREKGDLKENAEYDAAKEAQGLLEMRIAKLEHLIANATVIEEAKMDLSRVGIFSKVTVKNVATQQETAYTLVGEEEADLKMYKISVASPIGRALVGKRLHEVVSIQVPAGKLSLQITKIASGIGA